jgi:glycosyltransferase involved in cell wall biosynthesis
MDPVEVSIVMPCLNEGGTLACCIEKAGRSLAENHLPGEIIVADNGSTDGSPEVAARAGARVVSVPRKGYGNALIGGINAARGRFIIIGDADDSYDFSNLNPFVEKLMEGFDLVVGNRFKGEIKSGAMKPLHRYVGNPLLSGIGRLFFKSPCGDFHCGMRGFTKEAVRKMDLRTSGMEFASEMVVKATLLGMRIAEVPVSLSPDGRGRQSHLRSWRDGWRHLRFLLLFAPRWLFLYPGVFLFGFGLAVMGILLPGPLYWGAVSFDIHTMLYAGMSVLIGFQAILFAAFTKIFAVSEGFVPRDARLEKILRFLHLEKWLVAGLSLAALGLAGAVYAVEYWGGRSFGQLDPVTVMRIVIPSAVFFTLGFQIVMSGFFLSILGMGRISTRTFSEE